MYDPDLSQSQLRFCAPVAVTHLSELSLGTTVASPVRSICPLRVPLLYSHPLSQRVRPAARLHLRTVLGGGPEPEPAESHLNVHFCQAFPYLSPFFG